MKITVGYEVQAEQMRGLSWKNGYRDTVHLTKGFFVCLRLYKLRKSDLPLHIGQIHAFHCDTSDNVSTKSVWWNNLIHVCLWYCIELQFCCKYFFIRQHLHFHANKVKFNVFWKFIYCRPQVLQWKTPYHYVIFCWFSNYCTSTNNFYVSC